jgi:2-hydroxycyclohexanecarboxyl-CoA dehydrogenase
MNKVALVTGGGGGIGTQICHQLAASGYSVAVCDIDMVRAQSTVDAIGRDRSQTFEVDLCSVPSMESLVVKVSQEMGNPQLLINNAGWDKVEPFLQSDFATWDKLVQINLLAPITLSKLVAPGMIEAKWGRFVHISSDAARVGSTGEAVYSACKAGIVGFSKTIAREFARSGITSNVVCPGPTNTALLREVAGENEKLVESLKRNIPVGRIGEPKDVAGIVRFFCSDDAEYITGQTISVSGGLTMV